ncbi:cold-inducible protein YdjO [Bacillus oleivorans]|uniref:Cold-inducible protein YdjO n=1 Tax=Bacillus oleivorans TaxID=1448271 RepID=A0A285CLL8_9BACI|nr:cold-shock protein [Bacillus oleivorans]SNX68459.1 cold-inducible protein YdjO [Bacillus oleivorans]
MFNRRNQEEVEKVETKVWVCTSDDCNCWVRDNFKSSEVPACPICESKMEQTTRVIEILHNPSSAM